jgi:hypothetical protein
MTMLFRDRAMPVTIDDKGGTKAIRLRVIPASETAGVLQ